MRTRMLVLTALIASTALVGCAGQAGGAGSSTSPVGTWGDTDDTKEPSLTFADDGTVSGTDGCNRLAGGWEETYGTITLSDLASTLMACDGVDTWLSAAATAVIDGDELVVSDRSGTEIGKLDRE